MSLVIGSTIATSNNNSQFATILNSITWTRVNMGVAQVFGLVGLLSANNGALQNNAGQSVTLNASIFANLLGANVGGYLVALATSPDGINWTEAGVTRRGALNVKSIFIQDCKVVVPDQHYIALVAKTTGGSFSIFCYSAGLFVRSDEGMVANPLIDIKCGYAGIGGFHVNSSGFGQGVWGSCNIPTLEFPDAVGAISNGQGGITNNTGQTITVDGCIILSVSGTTSFFPMGGWHGVTRNNVSIAGVGAAQEYNLVPSATPRQSLVIPYTVTLAAGDFIRPAQFWFTNFNSQQRNYVFQHTMRSRT